jgi:hypothetical protein
VPPSIALLSSLVIYLKEKPQRLWPGSPGHSLYSSIDWTGSDARNFGRILSFYGTKTYSVFLFELSLDSDNTEDDFIANPV